MIFFDKEKAGGLLQPPASFGGRVSQPADPTSLHPRNASSILAASNQKFHVAPAASSKIFRIHSERSKRARFAALRIAIRSDLLTRSFSNIPRAFEAGSFGLPRTDGVVRFISVRFLTEFCHVLRVPATSNS
jgi:hypothetical protein